jgi:hypothetical protein
MRSARSGKWGNDDWETGREGDKGGRGKMKRSPPQTEGRERWKDLSREGGEGWRDLPRVGERGKVE